jgi:RNA polymerase sigma factor (sigma-70 family)
MARRQWAGRRQRAEESDDQLCERARRGDEAAFGELYRRHRNAAEATARCFVRSPTDADDIVSDAFAGVLSAMRNGYGPRDNFRRYLLACVRNGCRVRARNVPVAPQDHRLDARRPDDGPILEDPERYVEANTVARAFSALSPRWQQMLWSTAVEQKSAQEIGEQLSMSPNAAAALAHRAREAFATAYLGEHLGSESMPECSKFVAHLAGYVRDQLPHGRAEAVGDHVRHCPTCSAAVADLRDVNASLRTLVPVPGALVPTALPLAAPPAVSSGVSGAASAGVSFAGLAVKGLVGTLIVAPFLIVRATGFDGGIADGLRRPGLPVDTVTVAPSTTALAPPAPTAPVVGGLADAPSGSGAVGARDELRPPAAGVANEATDGDAEIAGTNPDVIEQNGGSTSPTPSTTTAAEGLLGTLGVDDALEPVRLDVVSDAVDAIVYALTADVVAPVLAAAVDGLALPLDLSQLPPIPGVVLVPPTTVAVDEAREDGTPGASGPIVATSAAVSATTPATAPPANVSPATSAAATSPPQTAPPPTTPPPTPSPAPTTPPTTSPGLVCDVLDLLGLCRTG